MKILFLHHNHPDYLSASLFHGLRKLHGADCVDVPRYDCMYSPDGGTILRKCGGYGISLYGLLEEPEGMPERRFLWYHELEKYDLVVLLISASLEQWGMVEIFTDVRRYVPKEKFAIIDTQDIPSIFPFGWRFRAKPWTYLISLKGHMLFKRELIDGPNLYNLNRLLPAKLGQALLPVPKTVLPISFSIPREKIRDLDSITKTKDFPANIVDPEVAARVPGVIANELGSKKYSFTSEESYYADLSASRFGITTKRAGWDCMRHYELAANGCVLCFRDLDQKPPLCAPHGLDKSNCIIYHSYEDLRRQIDALGEEGYRKLQEGTHRWVLENTTERVAEKFLEGCRKLGGEIKAGNNR